MPSRTDTMGAGDGFDAIGYRYASTKVTSYNVATHSERNLWCAVIAQAFVDIGAIIPLTPGSSYQPRTCGREFDEAARWLLRNKSDFPLICDLAGVSPHVIRCAAKIFYGRRQLALGALHTEKGDMS